MLRVAIALTVLVNGVSAWAPVPSVTSSQGLTRPVLLNRQPQSLGLLRLQAIQGGQAPTAPVQQGIEALKAVASDPSTSIAKAAAAAKSVAADPSKFEAQVQTFANTVVQSIAALSAGQQGALASAAVFSLIAIFLAASSGKQGASDDSPYPTGRYDAQAAAEYFERNPALFYSRGLEILSSAAGFGVMLLLDYVTGKIKDNEAQRADELSSLLSRLGPTFIKLGQSLSIRTDLLSPAYVRGLTALQDKVPPFPTQVARETIEEELGRSVESVFSGLTEPVAAASLGQVFKVTLADGSGQTVAVKVQRPEIMTRIALDMHLIREAEPLFRLAGYVGDVRGLVDDWGTGFVNELNYEEEADNAEQFMADMARTPLASVVFAPRVVRELSTKRVLTTEWVDGERLEQSNAQDISSLCSVAMNCYLTMMLESGTMHCDPHPGNLLRSPDGRLCILDWGLVQSIPGDLRLTFIEHIAHLTAKDYDKVPKDLIALGFVPEGKELEIQDQTAVQAVSNVYTELMRGGGADKIDVGMVMTELQDLTEEYGQLFQLPPYFAYIARAFSTLEGIGLGNNPEYAIVDECLPYISQRLLTDPDPRTAGALKSFVFGRDKESPDRLLDVERLENLFEGFSSYSAAAGGAVLREGRGRGEAVEAAAEQLANLLLSEEQTPLQAIVLEQMARVLNAGARGAWRTLRERSGRLRSGRTVLGALVDPLGLFKDSPIMAVAETDERALAATRQLIRLLSRQPLGDQLAALSPREVQEVAAIVARKLWERRAGLLLTGNRFATTVLKQTLERLDQPTRQLPQGSWQQRAGAKEEGRKVQ